MVQYIKAIKLPFKSKKSLAIATILGMIPIVAFVVIGYILKVAKHSMSDNLDLPEWKNYKELFVLGLKATIILMIYVLPISLLQLIYLKKYILFLLYQTPFEITAGMTGLFLYSAIYLIIVLLLFPAALACFLSTGKIRDAFKPSKFYPVLLSIEYWFSVFVVISFSLGVSFSFGMCLLILERYLPTLSLALYVFFASASKYIILLAAMVIFAQTHRDVMNSLEGKV